LRVIAIANQKGGCGKTTTSINLSACLALLQKKILLIDLDPQGHSTCGFGVRAEKLPYSLYDLLSPRIDHKPSWSKVIVPINPYLSILPSYVVLSAAEEELANVDAKEKTLKRILAEAKQQGEYYDYVIIDCPPNLGILTFNALEACDEVIISIEPSFFSLHGLAKMCETLQFLSSKRVSEILLHALITIYDSRTRFAHDVHEEVKTYFQKKLFKTIIHESVVLKESASAGESIDLYDRESQAFRDYYNLAVEYLERDWNRRFPLHELGWRNIVRDRFGPRRVIGGVLFQVLAERAQSVEIVGDFNNWIPSPLVKREQENVWQVVILAGPGQYRYKFIVDGEWQIDPYHPEQRENAHGTYDSYLELV